MTLIAITGASGGGKSTLINELARRGFRTQPEVGREIVREQLASNGDALPWRDALAFRDLLFDRSVTAYDSHADMDGPVFFDRSFIEAISYSRLIGAPVSETMMNAARRRRFDATVFVCPPWPEIFHQDDERRHDLDFARRDYEATSAEYEAFGYRLLEIPRGSVAQRANIVQRHMGFLKK